MYLICYFNQFIQSTIAIIIIIIVWVWEWARWNKFNMAKKVSSRFDCILSARISVVNCYLVCLLVFVLCELRIFFNLLIEPIPNHSFSQNNTKFILFCFSHSKINTKNRLSIWTMLEIAIYKFSMCFELSFAKKCLMNAFGISMCSSANLIIYFVFDHKEEMTASPAFSILIFQILN